RLGGDGSDGAVLVGAGVVGVLWGGGKDREPGHRVGPAEGAFEDRVVERGGGVVELLGEDALEHQAVYGGPGRRVDVRKGVDGGPVALAAGLGQVVVDAAGVGQQRPAGRAGAAGGRPFRLRGAEEAETQLELV